MRKVARYDPDTGRKVQVEADSLEADTWSSRKPRRQSRTTRKAIARAERAVERQVIRAATPAVVAVGRAARRRIPIAAGRIGTIAAGAATVSVGTAAALAILVGAASYFGTRWLIDKARGDRPPEMSPTDWQAYLAARAFAEARKDAAKKLGRELTVDEVQQLGVQFKARLAEIGWRGAK